MKNFGTLFILFYGITIRVLLPSYYYCRGKITKFSILRKFDIVFLGFLGFSELMSLGCYSSLIYLWDPIVILDQSFTSLTKEAQPCP